MKDLKVDRGKYITRSTKTRYERYDQAITDRRKGTWSAAEDAIVLRDDLCFVEKVAILQRSSASISFRGSILKTAKTGNCVVCGKMFRDIYGPKKYCSHTCYGVTLIKSHCKYGHELAVVGRGTRDRMCKECRRVNCRSYVRRRREAAQARASESDL